MDYTNPIPDEFALLLSQKFKGVYMPSLQILRNKVEGFTSHYLISYISFSTGKSIHMYSFKNKVQMPSQALYRI